MNDATSDAVLEIESVSESGRYITVRLVRPEPFGGAVVFPSPTGFLSAFFPFARTRFADDLIERVERAHRTAS